ncbi:SDR family NAD(P)-dependent oxidoreductase [Neorhizobium sp. NCHU2750]|uniref:SDR family NAD(P)-dependent oxidoreductase n=1 Tax=Neorhizobium sp. NCHU2750 TaxID=1825976 RepID=UPI000E724956|nr:hypothetical protein NCHU2750_57970 [Neorhizobium sp. NCHU2750]
MHSLPTGYRAVVLGASGGIGNVFTEILRLDARCGDLVPLSRSRDGFDITDEESVAFHARRLAEKPVHLLLCATGVLTFDGHPPEKALKQIDPDVMLAQFRVNAVGPALGAKHFLPLLARDERSIAAFLSARVGSIADNRLGGWVSYRASKAALNQIVRTASIELRRTNPDAVAVAIHPGTVETTLSAPYSRGHITIGPEVAAMNMLQTLDDLSADRSGSFVAYDGRNIVW